MNQDLLPPGDPRRRPSQAKLVLIAIGVAIVTTLFSGALLFIIDAFRAKPLG